MSADPGLVRLVRNAPAERPTGGEKILRINATSEKLESVDDSGTTKAVPELPKYATNALAVTAGLTAAKDLFFNTTSGNVEVVQA